MPDYEVKTAYSVLLLPAFLCVVRAGNYTAYLESVENETGLITDEASAQRFATRLDAVFRSAYNERENAGWDFETNVTDYNREIADKVRSRVSTLHRQFGLTAKQFDWKNFGNLTLKRIFKFASSIGMSVLPNDKLEKFRRQGCRLSLVDLRTMRLVEVVRTACSSEDCGCGRSVAGVLSSLLHDVPLNSEGGPALVSHPSAVTRTDVSFSAGTRTGVSLLSDLTRMMAEVGDSDKLLEVWLAWHDAAGRAVKPQFIEYVKLATESAHLDGYQNIKEAWLDEYDAANMTDIADKMWEELEPLYKKLHCFVRMNLKQTFPGCIPPDGTIPAHILGGMWGQEWRTLYSHFSKYGKLIDVTAEMKKQKKIYRTAEEFFTSLGLGPLPATFWNKSIITKPEDRPFKCDASAWDFAIGDDYRIKACTSIEMTDLQTAHHEVGHVINYMLYRPQHVLLRQSANPAFREAVGDLITLSVMTNSRLKALGLLAAGDYHGKSKFTLKYQGVSPPIQRSEQHFDGGANIRVATHVPYLRYFLSIVMQFQLHEHLCRSTNQLDKDHPFHECDIHGKLAAGKILKEGLSLGRSKPWPDVLEVMAGTRNVSASSLKRYFAPLEKWLDDRIKGEKIGWSLADVNNYLIKPRRLDYPSFAVPNGPAFLTAVVIIVAAWLLV
ncbi:hypothetical protein MTO96_024827 [Rhipicephalus appendiculatus]